MAPLDDDLSDLVQRPENTGEEPLVAVPELRRRPLQIRRRRQHTWLAAGLTALLILGAGGTAWAIAAHNDRSERAAADLPEPVRTQKPAQKPAPDPEPEPEPVAPEPEPTPPPPVWNVDDPNSLQVVVNKRRPFNPVDWAPVDLVYPAGIPNTNGQPLRAEAAAALEQMYQAATANGVPFIIVSGFRSYATQVGLFESFAARDGVEAAETYSARAGFSEHQSGLTADLSGNEGCTLMECFGDTATGLWLRANAPDYGFILRYERDQAPVVGYTYEPWHFRYVGVEIATDMRAKGIVNLEDYLGLPAAPSY